MMDARSLIVASCLAAARAPAASAASNEPTVDFFAKHGCSIGPATRTLAKDAGFGDAAIDALLEAARADSRSVQTGDWVVLPPAMCRIQPPEVRSEIRLGDGEVEALTSNTDAYTEFGDRGCFIDGPALMERVQKTRGWNAEMANLEYLRFLAENLRSGDLAFLSDSLLRTPAGFQVLTGDCAKVPKIDEIRRSQALRDREFDFLVRADAPNVVCGRGGAPSLHFMDILRERTGGENTNAWMFFEVKMMAIGGGWYTGTMVSRMGSPRPPLCLVE